jgi:hypothetical protein
MNATRIPVRAVALIILDLKGYIRTCGRFNFFQRKSVIPRSDLKPILDFSKMKANGDNGVLSLEQTS